MSSKLRSGPGWAMKTPASRETEAGKGVSHVWTMSS